MNSHNYLLLIRQYECTADAVLLMFDVTNLQSFRSLCMWKNLFATEVRHNL